MQILIMRDVEGDGEQDSYCMSGSTQTLLTIRRNTLSRLTYQTSEVCELDSRESILSCQGDLQLHH